MNIYFFVFAIFIIFTNLPVNAAKHSQQTLEHFCQKHPKKWQGYYNLGCHYYQQKNFDSAENNFSNALKNCQELQSQESIFYNLGNTYFQLANNTEDKKEKIFLLEKSIQNYTSTLSLNPRAEDAKHNLEIAKKVLEQLKQQNLQENNENKNDASKNQNNEKDQTQQNKSDTSKQNSQNKTPQENSTKQSELNQTQANNQNKEPKQDKEMQAILQKAKNDEHILPANFSEKLNSNSEEKVLKNW